MNGSIKISDMLIYAKNNQVISFGYVLKTKMGVLKLVFAVYEIEERRFRIAERSNISTAGAIDFTRSFRNVELNPAKHQKSIKEAVLAALTANERAECVAASMTFKR